MRQFSFQSILNNTSAATAVVLICSNFYTNASNEFEKRIIFNSKFYIKLKARSEEGKSYATLCKLTQKKRKNQN